jgi:hypothetical protein
MDNFCVYAHTKPDGTIFYVGKGLKRRAKEKRGRNTHWQNVVNKYGYNIVVLADKLTNEQALSEEILLIEYFKKFNTLVNMTAGGEGMLGYKMPQSAKDKIRATKWGKNNPLFKGKIVATNRKTGIQKTFTGNKELESFGFTNSHVYKCLAGLRKTHKGHTFERVIE